MSRTWRLLLWPLLVVAAVGASFAYLDMDTAGLFSGKGLGQMAAYASEFFPPDLSAPHLRAIGRGCWKPWPCRPSAPCWRRCSACSSRCRRQVASACRRRAWRDSCSMRCAPCRKLVWGALMVLAAGLGPNAGTLALALHTGGVLGRLFAEALENTPAQPAEALRLAGSGRLAAFAYGTLPGVWPQLVAYTLYRWENNIRMASVLGFVGAGGLGQMLYFSLSLFQQAQAATVILAMLVLVLGVDSLSAWARQRWVSQ